jgi:nucleotide-binding universal stress UspA family protein
MYQRILVAVDGSPTSDLALHEAIQLAKALGSQLRLVHAMDVIGTGWYSAGYSEPTEMWELMTKIGRDILDKAATIASEANINVDTKLIEMNSLGLRIPEVIKEAANTWPADLIALGTHGRRGLSNVLLGSVAEGIVRIADKPVLLIRGK